MKNNKPTVDPKVWREICERIDKAFAKATKGKPKKTITIPFSWSKYQEFLEKLFKEAADEQRKQQTKRPKQKGF